MLKSHAHAHAHNVNVDLQRNSSGNTLDPSYSTSSVSSSMYTFQCVVSITYNHDILLKMAKAPLISYIPSQFCGTVKAFGPYPTPIDVHLSTSPVNYNAMMRENTSVLLWYLPRVKSPLWKPLCKNPSVKTPIWKPLSFHTSHWFITVHRGLGGRVLFFLSTECWVAQYHSGTTRRPMVW